MKPCPWCAEEIQDAALICRHCGRDVRTGNSGAQPTGPPSFTGETLATTNVMAIVSLVCAISSFVILPLVGSVLAVFFGGRAKREIAESNGRQGGEALATAGIVIGWIGIALAVVVLFAFCSLVGGAARY